MIGRRRILQFALAAALLSAAPSFAAEYGTAAEAEALLARAVALVAADEAAAIARFNDPNGGFRDRDLYVFCAGIADGKLTAHPALVGTDLRALKDKNGVPFGAEMLDKAVTGSVVEVPYAWPRPSGGDPVKKVSYVTRVGDQVCGVGYYVP